METDAGSGIGMPSQDRPVESPSLRVFIPGRHVARATDVGRQAAQPAHLSDAELEALDEATAPHIPTASRVAEIRASAAKKVTQLERMAPCAVCEMAFRSNEVIPVPLSDLLLQTHLVPPTNRPVSAHVLGQYDAARIDDRLAGLLLYPPGVSKQDSRVIMSLCASCHDCLNTSKPTLPRMAIANGNYIGWYDGESLSWLDEQMVALVSACVSMTSIAGGRQRCIRSHHYIVKNTHGPPLSMLPASLPDRVRVAIVGAMTPDQIARCKKRYAVDIPRCRAALEFLVREHASYASDETRRAGLARVEGANEVNVIVDRTRESVDPVPNDEVEAMEDTTSYSIPDSTQSAQADIESQWIEERTVLLDDSEQPSDYFFRRSNAFESSTRWNQSVDIFPLLFPGGRGGPSEPRKHQYSVHTWVKRCLHLQGNRFEKHEVFLLLAFDFLAHESARNRMFIRLRASTDAVLAGKVTQAVVKECIEYRKHLEDASAKAATPRPPSEAISTVLKLQRGLYAGEVGYYGSDKSRTHDRNDIFGFINRFGPLQLFFTISPDSAGTYAISSRSGDVDPDTITRANAHLLPTRTERRVTATKHPFQCALYFDSIMTIVIEDILGWNQTYQRPKRSGGLFGIVRAFAASAETQVSGDLHAHFAVWLYGFPTSASATEAALNDPEYRASLATFVDAISATTLFGVPERCMDPDCDKGLEPIPLQDSAYRAPARGAVPDAVAECIGCKKRYNSEQLLNAAVNASITSAEVDYIRCKHPTSTSVADEHLNVILREVQIHRWQHTKSCFKVTRRNPTGKYCRFERPVPPNLAATFVNSAEEVVHHRPLGSEYVNPYNRTLMELFRCNHDLRLVISSTSKDVASYICKYVMKPQNRIENETAMALAAYEKAVSSANARVGIEVEDMQRRGNSIYASWLYHVTNRQDIAATLAALFIHRESAFWFSHDVVRVHLPQLLLTFDCADESETAIQVSPEVVSRDTPVIAYSNALQKYWARPKSLEDLCLVDVTELYDLKSGKFAKRTTRQVLVLCGKALPDIDVCQDPEERERYFKTLVMLYKPSRRRNTPRQPSFEEDFAHFLTSGPDRAVALAQENVRRLADAHCAKRSTAEERVSDGPRGANYSATVGLTAESPDQEELDDACDESFAARPVLAIPTIDHQMARYNVLLGTETAISDAITNTAQHQLAGFDKNTHCVFSVCGNEHPELEANESGDEGTTQFLPKYQTRDSQLQHLVAYLNPIPWQDPDAFPATTPQDLPDFAPIEAVSRAFRLNTLQHVAFETVARHVLFSYATDIGGEASLELPQPPPSSGLKQQLIGYLGGEAGTGKSQVIHALLHFAKSWKREGSIEAIAFTGVAATNINGKTVHSARNIPVGNSKRANISTEMRSKFAKVVLTICDEVSMLPQTLLGRANAATKDLVSPDIDAHLGGRHILFCGDWLQIPPVLARPCYAKPTHGQSTASDMGYNVYSAINFVVFLISNMRARLDAAYTGILTRIRWGKTTPDDIAVLNTRVGASAFMGNPKPWFFHPVIVPTNEQRCAVNHRMIYETCSSHTADLYECSAEPTTSRSIETLKKVIHLDDSCTDKIPLRFLYFFGMPIMMTQRSKPVEQATANGTVAFIAGHQFGDNASQPTFENRNGCGVRVLRQLPTRLILKILGSDEQYDSSLPPGFLSVEPVTKSIQVDIPRSAQRNGKRQRQPALSLTVRQFAMVPAFACTPEKLQGLTCHDSHCVKTRATEAASAIPICGTLQNDHARETNTHTSSR